MNNFGEIINVQRELYETYKILAKKLANGLDCSDVISKIEDLKLLEDLEYEKLFLDFDEDDLLSAFFEVEDIPFKEDDILIFSRLFSKLSKRLFEVDTLVKVSRSLLNEYFDEDEMNAYSANALKEFQRDKLVKNGPEEEIEKAYIVFCYEYMMSEDNEKIKETLAQFFLKSIFDNAELEEEFVSNGFKIPDNWLCISSEAMLSENERSKYYSNLKEETLNLINFILNIIFNNEWENTDDDKILIYEFKSKIRASLYLLNEMDSLEIKDLLLELISKFEDENKSACDILSSVLVETEEDFKKYNKVMIPFEKTEIEKFEEQIYSLYETLTDLEIKAYKGIDASFDMQDVIEALRVKKVQEVELFKREMFKNIKFDFFNGEFSCDLVLENSNANIVNRARAIFDSLEGYVILKKEGYDEKEASDAIELPEYNELHKNIVYFFNESIENVSEELRDYLIKSKYDYIFENVEFELDALECNFDITKENLRCPRVFGFDRRENRKYEKELNEVTKEIIFSILNDYYDLFDNEDNKDALFQELVIILRGCLYTLSEEEYGNVTDGLKNVMTNCENIYISSAINSAVNFSYQDRENYPKLVLM